MKKSILIIIIILIILLIGFFFPKECAHYTGVLNLNEEFIFKECKCIGIRYNSEKIIFGFGGFYKYYCFGLPTEVHCWKHTKYLSKEGEPIHEVVPVPCE